MSAADSKKTFFCTPQFGLFGSVIDLGVDLAPVRDRIQACKLRYHRELWEIICDRGIQGGGGGGGGGDGGEGGEEGGGGEGGDDANQSNAPSPPPEQPQPPQRPWRPRPDSRTRTANNATSALKMKPAAAATAAGRKTFQIGAGHPLGFQPEASLPPPPPQGVRFQQPPMLPVSAAAQSLPQVPPQVLPQPPPPPQPPQGNQRIACLMRSKAKLPPMSCSITAGYLSTSSPISSPSSPDSCNSTSKTNVSSCAETSIVIEHRKLAAAPSTITADDVSATLAAAGDDEDFVPLRCGDWSAGAGASSLQQKQQQQQQPLVAAASSISGALKSTKSKRASRTREKLK